MSACNKPSWTPWRRSKQRDSVARCVYDVTGRHVSPEIGGCAVIREFESSTLYFFKRNPDRVFVPHLPLGYHLALLRSSRSKRKCIHLSPPRLSSSDYQTRFPRTSQSSPRPSYQSSYQTNHLTSTGKHHYKLSVAQPHKNRPPQTSFSPPSSPTEFFSTSLRSNSIVNRTTSSLTPFPASPSPYVSALLLSRRTPSRRILLP